MEKTPQRVYVCTNDYPTKGRPLPELFYLHCAYYYDYPLVRPGTTQDKRGQILEAHVTNVAYAAEVAGLGGVLRRGDNAETQTLLPGTPLAFDWEADWDADQCKVLARQLAVMKAAAPGVKLAAFGMLPAGLANPGRTAAWAEPWRQQPYGSGTLWADVRRSMEILRPVMELLDWWTVGLYPANRASWAMDCMIAKQFMEVGCEAFGKPGLAWIGPYWSYPDGPGTPRKDVLMAGDDLRETLAVVRGWGDAAVWAGTWPTIQKTVLDAVA